MRLILFKYHYLFQVNDSLSGVQDKRANHISLPRLTLTFAIILIEMALRKIIILLLAVLVLQNLCGKQQYKCVCTFLVTVRPISYTSQ